MKRITFVGAVLIGVLLLWRFGSFGENPAADASSAPRAASTTTGPVSPADETRRAAPPERSTLADALNTPAQDIHADLRLMIDLLETFRSNFPKGGNPVGSNAEITATLTGQNPLRLALIPLDHPAINRQGELCDRWGTPFFFHAESAMKMEIRSAGPDRRLWTDDDVALHP